MGGTEQRSFTEPILKFLDDEIQQGRLTKNQIASVAGDISGIGKGRSLSELAVRLAERIERRVFSGDGGDLRREVPERVERLEDGGKQSKEPSGQLDLFGNPIVENKKSNNQSKRKNNGLLRHDETVRSEGLPAGSPDGGEDARLVGKGSGQDSRGADGGRDTRSVGEPRRSVLDGSRPGEQLSESPKKNVNNNHVERGKDYAPKGVDARIEANIAMHKENATEYQRWDIRRWARLFQ